MPCFHTSLLLERLLRMSPFSRTLFLDTKAQSSTQRAIILQLMGCYWHLSLEFRQIISSLLKNCKVWCDSWRPGTTLWASQLMPDTYVCPIKSSPCIQILTFSYLQLGAQSDLHCSPGIKKKLPLSGILLLILEVYVFSDTPRGHWERILHKKGPQVALIPPQLRWLQHARSPLS